MTAHRTVRLVLSLLAGLLLAGAVATVSATAAQAENGYRFWGYYQWSSGQWAFSQKGADAFVPADGAVEGWRFALGGAKPRVPRAAGDFEQICGKTPAETGKKRVAVVVDPGTPEDAVAGDTPGEAKGTCVVTDPASNGAKILAAVAPVRIEKGLTCGVAGYPSKGCGDQVKNITVPATDAPVTLQIGAAVGSTATSSPSATPSSSDDSGAPWGIIIAAVVVVLLAGGGFALSRRRTAAK
ncbi:SCO2322 family protein [Kribbella sp. NPDC055110]